MSSSLWAMGLSVTGWGSKLVCLPAAPRVQLFSSAGNGWLHNRCKLAATSWVYQRSMQQRTPVPDL